MSARRAGAGKSAVRQRTLQAESEHILGGKTSQANDDAPVSRKINRKMNCCLKSV
jgi:hypothetical protein